MKFLKYFRILKVLPEKYKNPTIANLVLKYMVTDK